MRVYSKQYFMYVYGCGYNLAVFVIYTGLYLINIMDSHVILELGRILGNIWFFFHPTNIKTFTRQNCSRPGAGCTLWSLGGTIHIMVYVNCTAYGSHSKHRVQCIYLQHSGSW